MSERAEADVVIVGGGIWGLSTAFHLAELGQGRDVLLLERNTAVNQETTRQSAGQIGQLRGDLPLARAIGYTLELFGGFRERTGHDPGFVKSGSIHLAMCDERASLFSELARLAASVNIQVEEASADLVQRLAPGICFDQVKRALWVPHDGYVNASAAASALAAAAIDRGVRIATDVEVVRLLLQGDRVRGVETTTRTVATSKVILAAGPWTGVLARTIGFDPPFMPIRLQQARTVAADVPDQHPVIRVPDQSCYIRPERGGYLHGFFDPNPLAIDLYDRSRQFATRDVQPERQLVDEMQRRLIPILPRLQELEIEECRQGMITCSPDGRFVIGPVPKVHGLWLAAGCGGTGIAAAGAVGRWLAQSAALGHPGDDLSAYHPGRFGVLPQNRVWLRDAACATSAAYYRLPDRRSS